MHRALHKNSLILHVYYLGLLSLYPRQEVHVLLRPVLQNELRGVLVCEHEQLDKVVRELPQLLADALHVVILRYVGALDDLLGALDHLADRGDVVRQLLVEAIFLVDLVLELRDLAL